MSDTPERPALPPQMVLYQMAIGHYLSRALHAPRRQDRRAARGGR